MKLLDSLTQENIILLRAEHWEDAINEMTSSLVKSEQIPEIDKSLLAEVINQESCLCSFASRGLAYPHIYSDEFNSHAVILGISNSGIVYDDMTGLPCHIILMSFGPAKEPREAGRFLNLFRTMVFSSSIRLKLTESKTVNEIISTIQHWEDEQQDIEE